MINKGQVLTHYYRIMNKNGGYTWIQTCATVVCSAKNADEQNIICVNYVITNREQGNIVFDQCQLGIIKREPIVYQKPVIAPKSPNDNLNELSKSQQEVKAKLPSENKSLDTSSKDSKICDDEVSVSGKRGRKRKVKAEAKEEGSHRADISVKELENVISKHLPKAMEGATDFSTDTLLRNADASNSDKSSSFGNFPSTSTATMPATALLRQLYANRESVIRATTRPSNYLYPDTQQQSLPTPPNDSSFSSDSQYLINSRKSSTEVFGYSGGAYSDYNNAMTPPSSVSPRDLTNHKSSNYEYTNLTTSSTDNRLQYQTTEAHLPLKPQPYALHQMDAHHHSSSYGIEHQSQYFSPYHHTGFHLYHKNIYTPP